MTRKFPKNLKVNIYKQPGLGGSEGHSYCVSNADGGYLASGWELGTRKAARDAAWRALEEIGLVVDE